MSPAERLHRSLLWPVLFSTLAFAAAESTSGLGLIVVPFALVAWWITRGDPDHAMPRLVINVALFMVSAWGGVTVLAEDLSVELFSKFVGLLLVLKLLDRRRGRDSAQVISLTVFLTLGAILTSNGLLVGLSLLGYLPALIGSLMSFQVFRASEHAGTERVAADPGLRRAIRRQLWIAAGMAAPVGVVIFVIMPRQLGTEAFGGWGTASVGRVVGFNDEVSLGSAGLISESTEPVLDLTVFDREGNPIGRPGQRYYLRGAVLDSFDNETGRWQRSADDDRVLARLGSAGMLRSFATALTSGALNWDLEQRVVVRSLSPGQSHLFAAWQPRSIEIDARVRYRRDTGELRVRGRSGRINYTVRSLTTGRSERDFFALSGEQDAEIRDGPSGPALDAPLLRQLAVQILEDGEVSPDPVERPWDQEAYAASLIESYFTREDFSYTLDIVAAPDGRSPVEWFVLDAKTGHCEYFASAMAALCRTVGINARVVTGYIAADFHEATGHYVVRASNAHAWVEVEVEPELWRRYDPTPAAEFERLHEPSRSMLADLRRTIESIQFAWINAIVSFDAERRGGLLGGADGESGLTGFEEDASRWLARLRDSGTRPIARAAADALTASLITLAVGIGAVLLWHVLHARRTGGPRQPGGRPEVRRLERLVDRAFGKLGEQRPASVPRGIHLQTITPTESGTIDPIRAAIDAIHESRFGSRTRDADELARLARDLRSSVASRNGARGR
ncbi:MAG: DUF3488 and transglutaminase-like domain-containing protein [Planctomycetota bacterium]